MDVYVCWIRLHIRFPHLFPAFLKTLFYYVSYTVALPMWFYNVLHAPGL